MLFRSIHIFDIIGNIRGRNKLGPGLLFLVTFMFSFFSSDVSLFSLPGFDRKLYKTLLFSVYPRINLYDLVSGILCALAGKASAVSSLNGVVGINDLNSA